MSVSCSSFTNAKCLCPSAIHEPIIMSRTAAEKRLRSLQPETAEYTQLWGALAKTVGIVEIHLSDQTYKVCTQKEYLLGGFGSSEHFEIGSQVHLGELEDLIVLDRDDVPVQFGHIIALAGDFYGVVNRPISLLGGSVEEKEERFLAAFATLEEANPEQIKQLIHEVEDEHHDVRQNSAPHHCYSSRLISSNNRFKKIKGDIDELLIDNSDHFSENAKDAYLIGHALACKEAAEAGNSQDLNRLKRAYALEAFACHFLTDLFAAGHIRNQRGALELFLKNNLDFSEQCSKSLSGILTGAQHEYDGERGLEISNQEGETWRAYGDGFFFTPKNTTNQEKSIEAVQTSIDEVTSAYQKCSTDPTKMERLIPHAKIFNHDPLYSIENEQLFVFKEGEKIRIQSKKDYLLKAIPLGLNVLPESYINGFLNAYLFPFQLEFPQEIGNIGHVLSTIITPRVERLTGKLWRVIGVASSVQVRTAHETSIELTKELMATAKTTHEQGEKILSTVIRIENHFNQEKLHTAINNQIREPIRKIQASFEELKNPHLDDKQIDRIQNALYEYAHNLSTVFKSAKENEYLFLDQPLLKKYAEIRLPKESPEMQKIEITRWFRQILRYQVVAFSTYLKLKYAKVNDREKLIGETRHFEKIIIDEVKENEDFINRDALFCQEAHIKTMVKKIEMDKEFLEFIQEDQQIQDIKPDPKFSKEYGEQAFEISYAQPLYLHKATSSEKPFYFDNRFEDIQSTKSMFNSRNDLNSGVLETLIENHPEVAVCLIVCSKLKKRKEEMRSAFEQQINELSPDISNNLRIHYGEDLYDQLERIEKDIEGTQKITGRAQEHKDVPRPSRLIPNNGSGLRCGYYAMAAGILQLPQQHQKRIFRRIEVSQQQLKGAINQDQYTVGDRLFAYSIQNPGIFTGPTQMFINTMIAAFTDQRNIPEAGEEGHYDLERLDRTIAEIQQGVGATIDIYADRIQLLANHLAINCRINGQVYGGAELNDAPEIQIYNPRGGHYESVRMNRDAKTSKRTN